ncbi:DUF3047 domain-containing protein [Parasalinivibrio latis]|uniref:DUF3047 domain-containing protein n=1 Tax=Parasalinivibrio latis TaxID=2952610 RepID=UPI0030E210E2
MRKLSRRHALQTVAGLGLTLPCAAALAQPPRETENFTTTLTGLIDSSGVDIERVETFELVPADRPWQKNLGLIAKGQHVTFLLNGKWWMSKEAGLWVEPGLAFFAKVGNSPIYNPMRNTGTYTAPEGGMLSIARGTGDFTNEQGELFPTMETYLAEEGHIEGVAIFWKGEALDGLYRISSQGDAGGVLASEINRLNEAKSLPPGWHNHYLFGDGGIFTQPESGHICCNTHKNVGILQYPMSLPLKEQTKLHWKWTAEKLPSDVAEDALITHDYLSIAVEFDDGQDITYMWSSELPIGKVFRCPIPMWNPIETHVVQRNDPALIGKELTEERDLFADYHAHIGGPAQNITRIWLIANTVFMRQNGRCCYRDIEIEQDRKRTRVL